MDEFKLDHIQRERAEALFDDMCNSTQVAEALAFELIWRRDKAAAALSQPAAQSYEHQRAIMEGHRNEAAEIWQNEMDYTDGELRAFDQGFNSGWDRAKTTAQVDSSHSADGECGGVQVRKALGFYADPERYHGPNQRVVRDHDPFTPEDAVYIQDVTRDGGAIARAALAIKATP